MVIKCYHIDLVHFREDMYAEQGDFRWTDILKFP